MFVSRCLTRRCLVLKLLETQENTRHYCAMSDSLRRTVSWKSTQRSKSCGHLSKRYLMDYSSVSIKNMKRTSSYEDVNLETKLRNYMCERRYWQHTKYGSQIYKREIHVPKNSIKFTILSYNILAQSLLEEHQYLYKHW